MESTTMLATFSPPGGVGPDGRCPHPLIELVPDGFKMAPEAPTSAPRGPEGAQEAPRAHPEAAKMPRRGSQDTKKLQCPPPKARADAS
eukprot:690852-Pyramimonas_sp.AAC.1